METFYGKVERAILLAKLRGNVEHREAKVESFATKVEIFHENVE